MQYSTEAGCSCWTRTLWTVNNFHTSRLLQYDPDVNLSYSYTEQTDFCYTPYMQAVAMVHRCKQIVVIFQAFTLFLCCTKNGKRRNENKKTKFNTFQGKKEKIYWILHSGYNFAIIRFWTEWFCLKNRTMVYTKSFTQSYNILTSRCMV